MPYALCESLVGWLEEGHQGLVKIKNQGNSYVFTVDRYKIKDRWHFCLIVHDWTPSYMSSEPENVRRFLVFIRGLARKHDLEAVVFLSPRNATFRKYLNARNWDSQIRDNQIDIYTMTPHKIDKRTKRNGGEGKVPSEPCSV